MSRIKELQGSRNFPRISRAKTLNGIREMRIYFGSVATRSEVQRNVGRISVMNGFVLSDVTDPIEAIRNAPLLEWLLPQQAVGN